MHKFLKKEIHPLEFFTEEYKIASNGKGRLYLFERPSTRPPAMGGREPGQARNRAAISGYSYVPGFSLKVVFFVSWRFPILLAASIGVVAPVRRIPPPSAFFDFYRLFTTAIIKFSPSGAAHETVTTGIF